ncbi:MAG: hemin uptake protein HemP [Pirellulaceae bacterium]
MANEQPESNVNLADDGPARAEPSATARVVWNSLELLGGHKEVVIQHGELQYRLRQTKQGKLILYR